MESFEGEKKMEDKSRFKVGQDVVVWAGKKDGGRFVTIQENFPGPDGKTWIRAWWPGMDTDPEIEMNWALEKNGLKVDPDNHIVEGPEDKFR